MYTWEPLLPGRCVSSIHVQTYQKAGGSGKLCIVCAKYPNLHRLPLEIKKYWNKYSKRPTDGKYKDLIEAKDNSGTKIHHLYSLQSEKINSFKFKSKNVPKSLNFAFSPFYMFLLEITDLL